MKRHGNLWPDVVSFEALLRAADGARRGKRFRPAVAAFHFDQERALWKLHEELTTKTYQPGAYRLQARGLEGTDPRFKPLMRRIVAAFKARDTAGVAAGCDALVDAIEGRPGGGENG